MVPYDIRTLSVSYTYILMFSILCNKIVRYPCNVIKDILRCIYIPVVSMYSCVLKYYDVHTKVVSAI